MFDYLKQNHEEANEVKAERITKTHDLLALVANSYTAPQPYNAQQQLSIPQPSHATQPSSSNMITNSDGIQSYDSTSDASNDDPFENINKAMMFFAKAFSSHYSTSTNNILRTSLNTIKLCNVVGLMYKERMLVMRGMLEILEMFQGLLKIQRML